LYRHLAVLAVSVLHIWRVPLFMYSKDRYEHYYSRAIRLSIVFSVVHTKSVLKPVA